MIRYVRHNNIDKKKWDYTITNSLTGLMYGFSWYLDIISPGWDALISDDCEAIMPLTWKKRYNLYYLIQPLFARLLGIFSIIYKDFTSLFLSKIPFKFFYININLNIKSTSVSKKYLICQHSNYTLSLLHHYEVLQNNYNRSTKNNLRKSLNSSIQILDCEVENGVDRLINEYNKLLGINTNRHKDLFTQILISVKKFGKVDCFGAFNNNKLVAIVIALIVGKNISIQTIASEEVKKLRSLFLLYDYLISKYSNQDMFIDFGGSDIESIAYFFSGFGSVKENYYQIKYSNFLPRFIL